MGAWEEFLHSPIEVAGAIVTIGGGLASVTWKPLRVFWLGVWDRIRSRPVVPSETLRIVQNVNGSRWSEGKMGEKTMIHVVFDGHVTDVSGRPNRVLRAEILKPPTSADLVLIADGHDGRRPQVLDAHESAELHTSFFVDAALPQKGVAWHATLMFTDQYGNKHHLRKCTFGPAIPNMPEVPKEPEEFPYQIADPIEKEIVSVLKSELARYAICGRRVGGLGSVHIVYQGRALTGVGGDSWRPDSPANQVLAPDPEKAALASDNLDALVGFFQSLCSDEERNRFHQALLSRLDAKRGYLAASYFIVAALWKTGALTAALRKARTDLPQNETRLFGLSNVLMLLNGLLRYRHSEFTPEMLDEIERLVHGLSEHPFMIHQKLAAIRADRLKASKR